MPKKKLYRGDCRDVLKERLEANSVDSVVTDCPYELGFMGKHWDQAGVSFDPRTWKRHLRVLKPGAYLLAFGGSRTFHRIAVAIEDAGFEIRDCIVWVYGSGFPKSHDISKAIDVESGNFKKREVIGERKGAQSNSTGRYGGWGNDEEGLGISNFKLTNPYTPEAEFWNGWGTALKPAMEPIIVARKPLSEKTVAKNVLRWGTGGLNIDGCRIHTTDNLNGGAYGENRRNRPDRVNTDTKARQILTRLDRGISDYRQPTGRFPANVILDEEAGRMLGEPTRFFYCAKASKAERELGCENQEMIEVSLLWESGDQKVVLRVDTEQLLPRVIGVSGTQKNCGIEWSMMLSGNAITALFQKANKSITVTATNSITESKTLSWYLHLLTNESIPVAKRRKVKPISRAGNAAISTPCLLITFGKTVSLPGVGHVASGTQLIIKGNAGSPANHPTVKPLSLMRYLCRLVTPVGGTVLDGFMGSGTTGMAALLEGFGFIGIEAEKEFYPLAKARIGHVYEIMEFIEWANEVTKNGRS